MDERRNRIVAGAMGLTLGLLYIGLIAWCLWKYVQTKNIENCTIEIILIVLIPASIRWFARKDESLALPRTLSGDPVPTDDDPDSKRTRKRHYFWDALGFTTFILIATVITTFWVEKDWTQLLLFPSLSDGLNIVTTLTLESIISFIIFFMIGYILDERSVRKYNKKMDELEDSDE